MCISLGVLHHTKDCHLAIEKLTRFVRPRGYIYLGLYHLNGRRPMLNMLQGFNRWYGEEYAFNLYKSMNEASSQDDHAYSWFRDQVIHPHETQHTFAEIADLLSNLGFSIKSTSINNYKSPVPSNPSSVELEHKFELYSYEKNVNELSFLPGYFTICARKKT